MYVQAAGQWLFLYALHLVPTAWNAHVLAVFTLNSAFVAMITGVVYGWTRSLRGAAVCLAVVLGFVATQPWILSLDWMPWMYVPAYITFLIAAASVAAGASRDLWILTLAGWFLIHGHACFLFFVPVILAAALAAVVWQHGPRASLRAFFRPRAWVPVAVISAVFALPIVVNLALHWPGRLRQVLLVYLLLPGRRARSRADRAVRAVVLVAGRPHVGCGAGAGGVVRGRDRRGRLALARCDAPVPGRPACRQRGLDAGLRLLRRGRDRQPVPLLHRLLLLLGADHHAAGDRAGRGARPACPLGAVLAAGAAVLGVAAFAAAPATAVSTEDTDAALPHAVQAVAAQAHGKTIVIRFNHNAWIDVTGFLVQAERTGVRACVQDPTWTFMMSRQFICTPGQISRRRAVLVQRADRTVRDDGHRHPEELPDHRRLRAVVGTGRTKPGLRRARSL